jgi:hypothetical protein
MLTPVRKLEASNEGLNATMDVSYDAWGYEGYRQFYWEEYGYNYKEIRGDRVVFFITYPGPGTHTFTYFARVTTPGTFAALPPRSMECTTPPCGDARPATGSKSSRPPVTPTLWAIPVKNRQASNCRFFT